MVVTVQKSFIDRNGDETLYTFSATAVTEAEATMLACTYASMVEFGIRAKRWEPQDLAFPREQLYQFIQPSQLEVLESMYPEVVETGYSNALAYVQSYIGAMFDVDAMLASNDTSSSAMTLRLALAIKTVTYILASSPQYSDTVTIQSGEVDRLLRGLKSGGRNLGRNGIVGDPEVRVAAISLTRTGGKTGR